jgi:hypothetical protein
MVQDDFDPVAIQREAAMFYGLFLRGQAPEEIRADIDIPRPVLERWMSRPAYGHGFRETVIRIYNYRKKVLAVFDELVDREKLKARMQ